MQATVHEFDPERSSGTVITDDGLVLPFDAEAFASSGLRHARPGQRLSITLDRPDGRPAGHADEAAAQPGAPSGPRVVAMRLGSIVPG